MLTNEKVTVFRYSAETEEYEPIGTFDAWVFVKSATSGTTKGDENADIIHIRIRKDAIDSIRVGDFVYIGNLDEEITDMSTCRKVVRVTNNKYGTVPHWHLEV